MAGLVPAIPIVNARQCPPIGMPGTSPGMTEFIWTRVAPHALLASAPSIMSTVFFNPNAATNEPKRGPFS